MSDALISHDPLSEASILGAVLLEPALLETPEAATLRPGDFYLERHALVWIAIQALREHGTPLDVVTIHRELVDRGWVARVGGPEALAALFESVPGVTIARANLAAWVERVVDDATRRRARGRVLTAQHRIEQGEDPADVEADLAKQSLKEKERKKKAPAKPLDVVPEPSPAGGYACTDLGNGERLRAAHGQDLIYVPEVGWHIWDGRCWVLDESCQVERWMHQVVRAIPEEADGAGKDVWQRLMKHAMISESTPRIRAAIESARCYLTKPIGALNANHWRLYLENGALDLRTGELLPADRADLCSRISPIRFDPAAKAPRWQQFLEEVMPDPETRAFLQRVAGYCLTGSVQEHCVFLLLGPGRNGKGVFTRALSALLGQAAHAADFATFLATRNPKDSGAASPDVAALAGRRLVTASEPPEGARWNEAQIKNWAGGDPIYARNLHHDPFTFNPTFKLMFSMNLKPETRDLSYAFWERIRLIEFNQTISAERRDPRLDETLRGELPGILNWALEGCLRWQEVGLGSSKAVERATAGYRSEQDPSERFLAECVDRSDPDARTSNADLWTAWTEWCATDGEQPRSKKWLSSRMAKSGLRPYLSRDRGWCVALKPRGEATFRDGSSVDPRIVPRREFTREETWERGSATDRSVANRRFPTQSHLHLATCTDTEPEEEP